MESRDTILRLIKQTALILRAVIDSISLKDQLEQEDIEALAASLKQQTQLNLDTVLQLDTFDQLHSYIETLPAFDAQNQELLADLLVVCAPKYN